MPGVSVQFDQPWYLLLLAILPVVWWYSRRSLSGLSRGRRWAAIVLRAAVFLLLAAALSEAQIVRTIDRLAVFFLVDWSYSVPQPQSEAALAYVNRSIETQADAARGDLAGVIVFGRQAAVEYPASNETRVSRVEADVDREYSDLADALKLAQASFPPDVMRRVVLLSDGNENLGSALEQARAIADNGIGIDVVPLSYRRHSEVAVEKVSLPTSVRQQTPFDVRVVLNYSQEESRAGAPATGRLTVHRRSGDTLHIVAERAVQLPEGKSVFTLRDELPAPGFYTYEARFTPDDPAADTFVQNNRGTGFTQVRGRGHVLLIEDWTRAGEASHLANRLRAAQLEVTVRPSNAAFQSLADLQAYDVVVLADVPRTSGEAGGAIEIFTDDQINALVRNTQHLGAGLVLLGGPNSFGAGGWANSPLEQAMPVDFQIKSHKVVPTGALLLVIDRSGSMSGEKLSMSKLAAIEAARMLGPHDQIGVVAFDTEAQWVVRMQPAGNHNRIAALISRLSIGGGTYLMPGMEMGYRALEQADAAVKHMIVLSDGHTEGSGYAAMAARMQQKQITTSAVGVGAGADDQLMEQIANRGGGKFYHVDRAQAIPRIFMREARRVARPLLYENQAGFRPQVAYPHEMLSGITGPYPPITGYVMTTPKQSPLVEIALYSPLPEDSEHNVLLAGWTYGLGRSVVLTTDAGPRWASAWTGWEHYDQLFSQIVHWAMRPADTDQQFVLHTDLRDGKVQTVVYARDRDDAFVNFLEPVAVVVSPGRPPREIKLAQTAPGLYSGEFEPPGDGTYFLAVQTAPGQGLLRSGVNVPYSAEFLDRETNRPLLANLAAIAPRGGPQGKLIETDAAAEVDAWLATDVFRRDLPPARHFADAWPLLAMCACVIFLFDVGQRRLVVSLAWLWALAARLRSQPVAAPAASPHLQRLRSRKDQVREQLDRRHMAPPETADPPAADLETVLRATAPPPPNPAPPRPAQADPAEEEEGYTARLLKAKRRVWEQKQ